MNGRVVSGVIALVYLVFAYLSGGGKALLQMTGFLALPIACIWYSDELGAQTGHISGQITTTTPGCLVAFGGWLLLSMPVIVGMVMWMMGR